MSNDAFASGLIDASSDVLERLRRHWDQEGYIQLAGEVSAVLTVLSEQRRLTICGFEGMKRYGD